MAPMKTVLQSEKPFFAIYISDIYARDPWRNVYRHYTHAFPLMPSSLVGKIYNVGTTRPTTTHGWPYNLLMITSLENSNTIQFDAESDGVIDSTIILNEGEYAYISETDLQNWNDQNNLLIQSSGKIQVIETLSGEQALNILENNTIDLILLDLMMPGMSGEEVLRQIVQNYQGIPVIIISAYGSIKIAVDAIKEGAYNFIEKPLDADRILITVKNALEKRNLKLQTERLRIDILKRYQMIGESAKIKQVFKLIELYAPTDSKVLITGESGTGKDLVARALHNLSPRVGFPFVKINCAAIPDSLIESELFGYEKGAFTGALSSKKGKIELAHQGTLFFDEIGDLKSTLQAKLLHLVENQEFERLGSNKTIKIDFRLITATNKDLETEIKNGRFREDLYYRLNSAHIHIAPIRERPDDILPLTEFFINLYCDENNLSPRKISEKLRKRLLYKKWYGNVRELKNNIQNLIIQSAENDIIDEAEVKSNKLNEIQSETTFSDDIKAAREKFEKEHILKILNKTGWNISESSRY